jgi:hypothetical protein
MIKSISLKEKELTLNMNEKTTQNEILFSKVKHSVYQQVSNHFLNS